MSLVNGGGGTVTVTENVPSAPTAPLPMLPPPGSSLHAVVFNVNSNAVPTGTVPSAAVTVTSNRYWSGVPPDTGVTFNAVVVATDPTPNPTGSLVLSR